jgi:Ca2+-binding RTX toxin-like protein
MFATIGNDTFTAGIQLTDLDAWDGIDTLNLDYSGMLADGRTVTSINFQHLLLPAWPFVEVVGLSDGSTVALALNNFEIFNITGASGADIIRGGDFADTLNGGDGDDNLNGAGGLNVLSGGAGNDQFAVRFGDVVDGGTGDDTITFNGSDRSAGITVNLLTGGGAAAFWTGVEVVTGTLGLGDDSFTAGIQLTDMDGSDGIDTLNLDYSGTLADGRTVTSINFQHLLLPAWPFVEVVGLSDGSTVALALNNFEIFNITGASGADIIRGGDFADTLNGGDGDDNLNGAGGLNVLSGGAGNDQFAVRFGDVVDGGTGDDTITFNGSDRSAGITVNLLTGGGAAAFWTGVEVVTGTLGLGDDSFTAGIQLTDMDGSDGIDTLNLDYSGTLADGRTVTSINFQHLLLPAWPFVEVVGLSDGSTVALALNNFEIFNITGASGADIIRGGDFADTLNGGDGDDNLNGAGGNDLLTGGAGNDFLAGGAGIDTAIFSGLLSRYIVSRDVGSGIWTVTDTQVLGEGTDTVAADVEILRFSDTSLDLLLSLSASTTTPFLTEGNTGTKPLTFTITRTGEISLASTAAWSLSGDVDAADFAGGTLPSGTVTFAAGEATQTITLNIAGDGLVEADEALTLTLASPVNATLATASVTILNDDTALSIAPLNADRAEGNAGSSTAFTFTVTRTGDLSGVSSASWAVTGSGTLFANTGDFVGGAPLPRGTVSFAAGEASKLITINVQGDARYEGDEGFTVILSNPSSGASIATAAASAIIRDDDAIIGTTGNDVLAGTTNADLIRALAGNDSIRAGDGNDVLEGNEGHDTLNGGLGADTLNGGDGTDVAEYTNAAARVVLDLTTGGTVGDANGDRYSSIETVWGSRFDDGITGDGLANLLMGDDGNDTLIGGAGDDTLVGGAGADSLVGGEGRDLVTFLSNLAMVAADLNGAGSQGEAIGDSYSGIEDVIGTGGNDTILGSAVANLLEGGAGNDSLAGREGNDTLNAGAGNDTVLGGLGDDSLSGGEGVDLLSYADAGAGVSVGLALLAAQATGGGGLDVISGFENLTGSGFDDSLTGDGLANYLSGGAGRDTLIGGLGNDTLDGGAGGDVLTGGAGVDRFVFGSLTDSTPQLSGRDVITDFSRLDKEKIDLRLIDANPFLEGDQAFTFITGDFTGAVGELSVASFPGQHRVRMDLDGDGVEDMAITVMSGIRSMVATDFFL